MCQAVKVVSDAVKHLNWLPCPCHPGLWQEGEDRSLPNARPSSRVLAFPLLLSPGKPGASNRSRERSRWSRRLSQWRTAEPALAPAPGVRCPTPSRAPLARSVSGNRPRLPTWSRFPRRQAPARKPFSEPCGAFVRVSASYSEPGASVLRRTRC